MGQEDIFRYERQWQLLEAKLEKSGTPTSKLLLELNRKMTTEGLTLGRRITIISKARYLAEIYKLDFKAMTKEEVEDYAYKITTRIDLSEWTKKDYKQAVRRCLKFANNENWVHLPCTIRKRNVKQVTRKDLLTRPEVFKIIDAGQSLRDKAFLFCLYESGARIGELASMKRGSVVDLGHMARYEVFGKCGARVISSQYEALPLLRRWLASHPLQNPDAPLWCSPKGKPLTYFSLCNILKGAIKWSGVQKKVSTRIFRKSRATELASKGISQPILNKYFGWQEGSTTSSHYLRMVEDDLDKVFSEQRGITEKKQEPESKTCPNCGATNHRESLSCVTCNINMQDDRLIDELKDVKLKTEFEKFLVGKEDFIKEMVKMMEKFKETKSS